MYESLINQTGVHLYIFSGHHTKMTFFWTKLLAGQGLSNISLKSVSVLYGNFSEKFPIIHKHSNTIQALGRPFKLTDVLAALGLNSC